MLFRLYVQVLVMYEVSFVIMCVIVVKNVAMATMN